MKDAFGVERVSKGLPSGLPVKGGYAGFRRAAHEEGRYAAKLIRRGRGRVQQIEVKQGQLDRQMSRDSLARRAKFGKAWKGEPGDKRNTKYAMAGLASGLPLTLPLGLIGPAAYGFYRQGATSTKNRKASIALKKKERKG